MEQSSGRDLRKEGGNTIDEKPIQKKAGITWQPASQLGEEVRQGSAGTHARTHARKISTAFHKLASKFTDRNPVLGLQCKAVATLETQVPQGSNYYYYDLPKSVSDFTKRNTIVLVWTPSLRCLVGVGVVFTLITLILDQLAINGMMAHNE